MTPELFINFTSFFPWGLVKIGILVLVIMYTIVAAVIVRQEQLMSKVVEIPFSPILRMVAIAHLIASVATLFLVFILL